jgi:hypothetical protein
MHFDVTPVRRHDLQERVCTTPANYPKADLIQPDA